MKTKAMQPIVKRKKYGPEVFAYIVGGIFMAIMLLFGFSYAENLDLSFEHRMALMIEENNHAQADYLQQLSERQWRVCPYIAGSIKAEICLRNRRFNVQRLPSVLLD